MNANELVKEEKDALKKDILKNAINSKCKTWERLALLWLFCGGGVFIVAAFLLDTLGAPRHIINDVMIAAVILAIVGFAVRGYGPRFCTGIDDPYTLDEIERRLECEQKKRTDFPAKCIRYIKDTEEELKRAKDNLTYGQNFFKENIPLVQEYLPNPEILVPDENLKELRQEVQRLQQQLDGAGQMLENEHTEIVAQLEMLNALKEEALHRRTVAAYNVL